MYFFNLVYRILNIYLLKINKFDINFQMNSYYYILKSFKIYNTNLINK